MLIQISQQQKDSSIRELRELQEHYRLIAPKYSNDPLYYNFETRYKDLQKKEALAKNIFCAPSFTDSNDLNQINYSIRLAKYSADYIQGHRKFSLQNINNFRKKFFLKKEDFLEKLRKIKHGEAGDSNYYKLKKTSKNECSLIKINGKFYLVTPLLLSIPTNRSIIKILVPIDFYSTNAILKFSNLFALKVNPESFIAEETAFKEIGELMYGEQEYDHVIVQKHDDDSKKSKQIFPVLKGITLDQFLQDFSKKLSLYERVIICLKITEKLIEIHAKNIVHADLKPTNIIINFSNTHLPSNYNKLFHFLRPQAIYEINYDISIIDNDNAQHEGTGATRKSLGTLNWVAPEIERLRDPQIIQVKKSMDIFSLGLIFYFTITGCYLIDQHYWSQITPENFVEKINHILSLASEKNSFHFHGPNIPKFKKSQHIDDISKISMLMVSVLEEAEVYRPTAKFILDSLKKIIIDFKDKEFYEKKEILTIEMVDFSVDLPPDF